MDNRVTQAISEWSEISVSGLYGTVSSFISAHSSIATLITATVCVWLIAHVMERYNLASVSLFKVINVVAKDDRPTVQGSRKRRIHRGRARR